MRQVTFWNETTVHDCVQMYVPGVVGDAVLDFDERTAAFDAILPETARSKLTKTAVQLVEHIPQVSVCLPDRECYESCRSLAQCVQNIRGKATRSIDRARKTEPIAATRAAEAEFARVIRSLVNVRC